MSPDASLQELPAHRASAAPFSAMAKGPATPAGMAMSRRTAGSSCGVPSHLIVKCMLNYSDQLDRLYQALADPTRRTMVDRLSRGPASVGELARPLAMSLPAVMQHLQVLEGCGLITSKKVGRVRTCSIDANALRTAEDWVAERRTQWEHRLDRLGSYLAGQDDGKD